MSARFGIFQSTPPVKAATFTHYGYAIHKVISIHAAREGGDLRKTCHNTHFTISIHAAREGGDYPAK